MIIYRVSSTSFEQLFCFKRFLDEVTFTPRKPTTVQTFTSEAFKPCFRMFNPHVGLLTRWQSHTHALQIANDQAVLVCILL